MFGNIKGGLAKIAAIGSGFNPVAVASASDNNSPMKRVVETAQAAGSLSQQLGSAKEALAQAPMDIQKAYKPVFEQAEYLNSPNPLMRRMGRMNA
jgi:hypothetical protein